MRCIRQTLDTFLSTPSARRATYPSRPLHRGRWYFYPRPPRGGRLLGQVTSICTVAFLSTPSARRATREPLQSTAFQRFLSTPSARRATSGRVSWAAAQHISIHALREEGDQGIRGSCVNFIISIHALREEGDNTAYQRAVADMNFYPRPPRGGRLGLIPPFCTMSHFYPRPPRGGRRCPSGSYSHKHDISIHALREEGDYDILDLIGVQAIFLSTPSARRATVEVGAEDGRVEISIHALREEGDIKIWVVVSTPKLFLSTPSARRATQWP